MKGRVVSTIYIGGGTPSWLAYERMEQILSALYQNFQIAPDAEVSTLSIAEKQLVEIARALNRTCRLLIMDEPSTVLNPPEVENLFRIIQEQCREAYGCVKLIYLMMEEKYHYELSKEEMMYLSIHIQTNVDKSRAAAKKAE